MMKTLVACIVVSLGLFACGPAQSADCAKYVACQTALNATAGAALDVTYGPNGTCWKSTAAVADTCTAGCKSSTATLAAANPNEAKCK